MKTVVLGSGSWGSALTIMMAKMGHDVSLWSAFDQEAEQLRQSRKSPFLDGVEFPENVNITDDISVASGADAVLLATPSFAVRETAKKLADVLDGKSVVVSVAKGIENSTSMRLSEIIEQETKNKCPVVALSGPSHAEEVSKGIPTGCVSASTNQDAALMVQEMLMNPVFRVYASDDIIGVELGGALKNVIALCCGVCDGMGFGDNTKAMLMTRGLAEMARLGVKMGGRRETFAGLTGVGDLIVTCTSMHSRNRRAGILIGKGMEIKDAMREVGAVVEGYYAAASAKTLAERMDVDMPISMESYRVLYENKDPLTVMRELMTRSKKHEIEEGWD